MDLSFDHDLMKLLIEAGVKSPVFLADKGYRRDRTIDTNHVTADDLKLIRATLTKGTAKDHPDAKRLIRKLNAAEKAAKTGKETEIARLEVLAAVLRKEIDATPRRWVFVAEGQALLPYFVESVRYVPPEPRTRGEPEPASTRMILRAISRGHATSKNVVFRSADLPATVVNALDSEDVILATDKLIADYEVELEAYIAATDRTGEQYLARGSGELASESSWRRDKIEFSRAGNPSRAVMDDELGRKADSGVANVAFWTSKGRDEEDEEEEGTASEVVMLPMHPMVRVFSLLTHDYADAHITCFTPYEYDATVIKKLVLPPEHTHLIDALTGDAVQRMSDIVQGKAQGIIILCSGEPGTGKTLTAEAYSEAAQRPLYTVQCSQLGTDEKELEKALGEVLERATRWKAILLIDEADVYIHERGDDIHQNAVVGVFLRLLEYYNGIMFLTTNRATVIDDAILSRATAHVHYAHPRHGDRDRIWQILLTQYEAVANDMDADALVPAAVEAFPKVSGRTIRQLIRLGLFLAKADKKPLTLAYLKRAAQFHDTSTPDDEDV